MVVRCWDIGATTRNALSRKGGSHGKDNSKDKSVLAVVEEELSDSDEDMLGPLSSSIYHSTSMFDGVELVCNQDQTEECL